jgi:translation elongation factor EF-1beta
LAVTHWDDEPDMAAMEEKVRSVQCDGLQWGVCMLPNYFYNFAFSNFIILTAKVVTYPLGDRELQIGCVVEDEKVSTTWLTEKMKEFKFRSLYTNNFKREWVPSSSSGVCTSF